MAEMPDVIGGETITSEWGNDIRDRTIQRYATVAARTAAHPTPVEGDLSYLQDSNTVDVYNGAAWVPFLATAEVDGSAEVPAALSVSATVVDAVTVNLAIPAGWASWKCEAYATFNYSGGATVTVKIRVDGTDQQPQAFAGNNESGAIGGRRTGMTTTGTRAVSLRASGTAPAFISSMYLYARAVRTA